MASFLIRVNGDVIGGRGPGRFMRVTVLEPFLSCDDWWCPVDVIDYTTRTTSQAIILQETAADPRALLAEGQLRDAVKSVWLNATTPRGQVSGGELLPDGFTVEMGSARAWQLIPAGPREN